MKALAKERSDILNLEYVMQQYPGYSKDGEGVCKITHHFAPGVYAREMWMPAGCLLTGKIHKTEHLNMLSRGKVSVSNKGESITMEAPYTFVSPIGTKRAIYAHEDSTWTTIHATDLTDPDEIESEIIAENFQELDVLLAHNDYEKFLLESDLNEDDVQLVTHLNSYKVANTGRVSVSDSLIDGSGLFLIKPMKAGDIIGSAMLNGRKTEIGRFTNHSGNPNAKMVVTDKDNINLVAIRQIEDEEITTDYRETMRVQGLKRIST